MRVARKRLLFKYVSPHGWLSNSGAWEFEWENIQIHSSRLKERERESENTFSEYERWFHLLCKSTIGRSRLSEPRLIFSRESDVIINYCISANQCILWSGEIHMEGPHTECLIREAAVGVINSKILQLRCSVGIIFNVVLLEHYFKTYSGIDKVT